MAFNFPNSPSNGDTTTVGGITYTYNSTLGVWKSTPATAATPAITSDGSTPSLSSGITAAEIKTLLGVTTDISAVVNGAPTGLDTLDEIAAAINDDTTFHTTVTNALAAKAALASPAFTGAPTAPTAGASTNTTQLATTAFVQQEIGTPFVKTDLSVTTGSASGGGSLSYNNSTGVFSFTPAGTGFSGVFSDLSSKPTTISGYGITDAFDGVFASLSSKPTTISGYGITDGYTTGAHIVPATTDVYDLGSSTHRFRHLYLKGSSIYLGAGSDQVTLTASGGKLQSGSNEYLIKGENIDLGSYNLTTTGKILFANMYSALSDLPSATTYHGMFAHVHATGAAYFAHAGNWVELANKSYVDTQITGLVDSAPGALDTLNELAAALNDDASFSTTVTNSLAAKAPLASPTFTGAPAAPTAGSGTNTTQLATTAFVTAAVAAGGGGGGGASVSTSDSAPSSPSDGDLWYNTSVGGLFVYYQDADSSQWVEIVGKTGATGPAGAGAGSFVEKTSSYTAVAGDKLIVDTSNAVTITLPTSATIGDEIRVIDGTGNANTNNITIARNGHKIQGAASNLTVGTERAAFGLVYYNAAQGWLLTER